MSSTEVQPDRMDEDACSPDGDAATPGGAILNGAIRPTVFYLALPILLQSLLSFLVAFCDTSLSGQISAEATSAVGMAAYSGWLASLMFGLTGTGTTALISRHWGAGETEDANRVMNSALVMVAILGGVVSLAMFFGAPVLAMLFSHMGSTDELVVRYLRADAFGQFFTSLCLAGSAALRGAGNMKTPMLVLGLMNLLNVMISTTLVFGPGPFPRLGVDGIIAGTVVGRVVGGLVMLFVLLRGSRGLKIERRLLNLHRPTVRRILRIGIPALAEGMAMWGGQFLFVMIITNLESPAGAIAFAAHMVGIQLEAITYLPAVAWGQASATMIGQSLGANKPDRAVASGHEAVRQCLIPAVLIMGVFYFGADAIYNTMHRDAAVVECGVPPFRILSLFQIPLVMVIVYTDSLRGAGDTRFPLVIMLFGMLCVRLPLAWIFGIYFRGGLMGAWTGMYADMVLRACLAMWRYSRAQWVHVKV